MRLNLILIGILLTINFLLLFPERSVIILSGGLTFVGVQLLLQITDIH